MYTKTFPFPLLPYSIFFFFFFFFFSLFLVGIHHPCFLMNSLLSLLFQTGIELFVPKSHFRSLFLFSFPVISWMDVSFFCKLLEEICSLFLGKQYYLVSRWQVPVSLENLGKIGTWTVLPSIGIWNLPHSLPLHRCRTSLNASGS